MKKQIKVSKEGRAYLHLESDLIDGRYKIVSVLPLGKDVDKHLKGCCRK